MLSRVEVAYLGILRVILLVAATIALIITVGAVVLALPAFATMTGLTGQQEVRGGTLKQFIETNRITDIESVDTSAADAEAKLPLPKDVREAAANFGRYDAKNGGEQFDQEKWNDLFRSILTDRVSPLLQNDYGTDVLRLSKQLVRSNGKPLSNERLFELLEFHLNGFLGDAQSRDANRAAEIAGSMSKLVVAGVAFLIFVLVLFNFIFVKIERNLRPANLIEPIEE